MKRFSTWVGPLVRATDSFAGEAVGMRVELQLANGQEPVGLFVHKCAAVHPVCKQHCSFRKSGVRQRWRGLLELN